MPTAKKTTTKTTSKPVKKSASSNKLSTKTKSASTISKKPNKPLLVKQDGETITVRRKSIEKKPVDKGELITVTVKKPTKSVVTEELSEDIDFESISILETPKVVDTNVEDIPDELLPTADELDLTDDRKKSSKKQEKDEDLWADNLEGNSILDQMDERPISDDEAKAVVSAKPSKVIKPKQKKEALLDPEEDDGKLLGYIKQRGRTHYEDVDPALIEHHGAHKSLTKPSVFDTQIVHPALTSSKSRKSKKNDSSGTLLVIICFLVIVAAVYLAIDYSLFGENLKVPYSLFNP